MYNIYDKDFAVVVYYGFNTLLQARDFMQQMELSEKRYSILEEANNGR